MRAYRILQPNPPAALPLSCTSEETEAAGKQPEPGGAASSLGPSRAWGQGAPRSPSLKRLLTVHSLVNHSGRPGHPLPQTGTWADAPPTSSRRPLVPL